MSFNSSIEWTQTTWNPVTGCTKVSPGCKFCYAERIAERFRGVPGHPFEQGFDLKIHPDRLVLPFRWKKPRLVFVNSMSDLFHEGIPHQFVCQVFETMKRARHHTFQVLTKRATEACSFFVRSGLEVPENVWLGVSVENQAHTWRIDALRTIRARTRFLSCEPLLGPLRIDLAGIHWVIVGGESGPRCRPIGSDWVRGIRDQCEDQRVAFFFKQWGGRNKKKSGRELDGRIWDHMPGQFSNRSASAH